MTTEEKARAYDEALKRSNKQRADYQKELDKTDKNSQLAGLLRAGISAIDMAFPELIKSEGEQIREDIMEAVENYFPYERIEEIRAYLYIEKQKEQPEVELEKFTEKIKTFQGRYKHPENISVKGAMAFMARMFYQYPNTARQWYDSLPKATMDDARKEE